MDGWLQGVGKDSLRDLAQGGRGPGGGQEGGGRHLRRTDPVFGLSVSVPEALGREPSAEDSRGPWGQGAGLSMRPG